jgi:hypothetical protein
MATYGPNYPGTVGEFSGDYPWNDLANLAGAFDGSNTYVNVPSGLSPNGLYAEGFGLSVPTDEQVVGFRAVFRCASNNGGYINSAQLYTAGGAAVSDGRSSGNIGFGLDDYEVGGASDLWGFSSAPTPSQVNNAGFGLFFFFYASNGTTDFYADGVALYVETTAGLIAGDANFFLVF